MRTPIARDVGGQFKDRVLRFATLQEKANYLDAGASLDATLQYVRDFERATFGHLHGSAEGYARAVQAWVRDHIQYVHDFKKSTGQPGEEFSDAEAILKRGYDDCDGKSRTFVALVRASQVPGLAARIRPVFKPHPYDFVHVQAECKFPGSAERPGADKDGWLLCEMILKDVGIGQDPTKAKKEHGKFVLANDASDLLIK